MHVVVVVGEVVAADLHEGCRSAGKGGRIAADENWGVGGEQGSDLVF